MSEPSPPSNAPAPHNAAAHRHPTHFSPGTGRRLRVVAAVFAVALVAAYVVTNRIRASGDENLARATEAEAIQPPRVVVVTADKAPDATALTLPGTTAAWYESSIYARVNGYVGKWFVDIGDRVKKGQVLARIETPELDAELAGAEAKLKSAEADEKVRQAQAEFAKTTYDRWRDSPKGVVSEQERDAKKADFDSATAQVNAAVATVNADKDDVDRLTAFTQFKDVTAPYDGIIVERRIDIGNLVTAGSGGGTASLYRMSQNDPIRVFVDVPQSVATDTTVGLPATVVVNGMPGKAFHGTVTRTANALDPTARTLRVEVDIGNPDLALVPGLYADVTFQLKARGLVQVPASALIFRSKGPQVAVVDGAGRVHFRDVRIVRDDGATVELGSGLAPGDMVALNISSEIADGETVTVAGQGGGKTVVAPTEAAAK